MIIFKKLYEKFYKRPIGTDMEIPIELLEIPKCMLRSNPSYEKIEEYRRRYEEKGFLDRPIAVIKIQYFNETRYMLHDQYIRYLIAKEKGLKKVPVQLIQLD